MFFVESLRQCQRQCLIWGQEWGREGTGHITRCSSTGWSLITISTSKACSTGTRLCALQLLKTTKSRRFGIILKVALPMGNAILFPFRQNHPGVPYPGSPTFPLPRSPMLPPKPPPKPVFAPVPPIRRNFLEPIYESRESEQFI